MKNRFPQVVCGLAFALINAVHPSALAQEPTNAPSREGTWKWTFTMPDGGLVTPRLKLKRDGDQLTGTSRFQAGIETPITLKQEGAKLTGKTRTRRAGTDTEIQHGKFKDGEISFQVERKRDGEKFVSRYYGKISGDKIQGKMELNFFGRLRTNDWEAIRVD